MRRALQAVACCAGFLAATAAVQGAASTPEDCAALRKHGKAADAHACYQALVQQRDPYLRAEGFWGLKMYRDANDQFRAAVARFVALSGGCRQ